MSPLKTQGNRLIKSAILLLLLLILGEAVVLFQHKVSQTHFVALQSGGFEPSVMTINQGDTVVFSTSRDRPFWPASDPHPNHSIYPEFDSKQPIGPKSSWSFTFNKSGTWHFHDHLFPSFEGTVVVLDQLGLKTDVCSKNQNTPYCWQNTLDDILNKQGLDQALNTFTTLYQTESGFASDCHGYAHKLGEEAFHLYLHNGYVPLNGVASLCSYGFYHGFMQSLLGLNPNPNLAAIFCDSHKAGVSPPVWAACYHGIGHGVFGIIAEDPSNWGKPQTIIDKSLNLCQKISPEPFRLSKCYSGVYMEFATSSINSLYGLHIDPSNPLSICRDQKDIYKVDCYPQFNGLLDEITNNNLLKGAQWIEAIADDQPAQKAITWLAMTVRAGKGQVTKDDVLTCKNIQDRLRLSCIRGLALGIDLFGTPGHQSEEAHRFCNLNLLNSSESSLCNSTIEIQDLLAETSTLIKQKCAQDLPDYTNLCQMPMVKQSTSI